MYIHLHIIIAYIHVHVQYMYKWNAGDCGVSVSDLKINCLNYSCACQRAEVDTLLSVVQTRVQSHAWLDSTSLSATTWSVQTGPLIYSGYLLLCLTQAHFVLMYLLREMQRENITFHCILTCPLCLWVSLHSLDPDCCVNFWPLNFLSWLYIHCTCSCMWFCTNKVCMIHVSTCIYNMYKSPLTSQGEASSWVLQIPCMQTCV